MKTTRCALSVALGLIALVVPGAVRADSTSTFDASGTFGDGSTLTGTVMIDTSDGLVTAIDLSVGSPLDVGPLTTFVQETSGAGQVVIDVTGTGGSELYLLLPGASLMGYGGSDLCSTTEACTVFGSFSFYEEGGVLVSELYSGELTEVTTGVPTPEPPSMFLLVAGLLGLMGMTLLSKRPA